MYLYVYISVYFTHVFRFCASKTDYVDLRPLQYYDTSSDRYTQILERNAVRPSSRWSNKMWAGYMKFPNTSKPRMLLIEFEKHNTSKLRDNAIFLVYNRTLLV